MTYKTLHRRERSSPHAVQLIDTTTGEVLAEQSRRLSAHYARIQIRPQSRAVAHPTRSGRPVVREAADLLWAVLLVFLMGLLLWILSGNIAQA